MTSWTRRNFLQLSLITGFGAYLVARFWKPTRDVPTRVMGPSAIAGHRLRDGFKFPDPAEEKTVDVLILGGGIAGLSAGWRLQKKGHHNFQILELESEVGGNSRSGENAVSKYPWGAHYLTLLNDESEYARELFTDFGIIKGREKGRDIYDESALCASPQERLFIYDKWQNDILPKIGVSAEDTEQYESFFKHLDDWRSRKGRDGRYAFSIPVDLSSHDEEIRALDRETMQAYMTRKGWTSKPLNWYVDYCCRDDYGTPHSKASAWAGIHYFCSRRERGDGSSNVLTWPEGNGYIVNRLKERLASQITTDAMAIRVEQVGDGVVVDSWSESRKAVTRYRARKVIVAMPRFVASHLSKDFAARDLSYAPWMVANITLSEPPPEAMKIHSVGDTPLAWDNVIYGGKGLGYVVATHQIPQIHTGKTVFTYYRPLDVKEPADARRDAIVKTPDQWRTEILTDLQLAHPGITDLIESIDVWVWGHAMARPLPGFIWGESRQAMQKPVGRVHFAHSDMSGLSIFEEAQYHGVRAADEVMRT